MPLGAVPMLDACRDLDDVAWCEALRCLAFFLIPALAIDADENLAAALRSVVDMPEIAAARLERDVADDKRSPGFDKTFKYDRPVKYLA